MAIGDIAGDIQNTYGQGLTPEQRAARQAALAQGSAPSSLATSPISAPPAGPIGRAQQQLAPTSSLNDPSFGLSSQGDARQTSFDVTNTPSKYLPPASQPNQVAQPTSLGQINPTPLDPVPTAQQPSSLTDAFKTAPAAQPAVVAPSVAAQLAPSTPGQLSQELPLDGTERSISSGTVVRNDPQVTPPAPSGGLGQINVTPFDPVAAAQQPASLTNAHLRFPVVQPQTDTPAMPQIPPPAANPAQANPSPIARLSIPVDASPPTGSLSLDQYRSTGAGTDASGANRQGGQIVAKVGPNGETSFSNATGDQTTAQSLGNLSVEPRAQTSSERPGSLADLGSASNLGDGIGTFSQAQSGDAALSMGRFQKAQDLRDSYKNKDRLDQALGAKWSADHTNVVHDSSKPLSLADIKFDQGQQQSQARADANVNGAQGLVDAGIKDRASEQQLRQSTRLEDALTAAVAPNATPEQKQRYQSLIDPTGAAGLDRQLKVAKVNNAVLEGQSKQQQIQQSTQSQAQGIQDKSTARKGQLATFDQALGSVDGLLGTKQDSNNPKGPNTDEDPGLVKALGKIDGLVPTAPGTDAADFEAKLDTLKAQTFIPQVAALKGMGALSDAEGAM
ncbi:hypothetical protein ACVBEG_03225 [Pseudomonas sp. GG8]